MTGNSRLVSTIGRLFRPGSIAPLTILLVVAGITIAAPALSPWDPIEQGLAPALSGPSRAHWFGTDSLGRDVLSRVIWGGRPSLFVALVSVSVAGIAGTVVGSAAGYFGGPIDKVISRGTDMFLSFPLLLLAIMIVAILGPGLENLIVAMTISQAPVFARLARSRAISVVAQPYMRLAELYGASHARRLFRHLLPNLGGVIATQGATSLAIAMLGITALNYLGLGVQPPTPDWGALVAEYQRLVLQKPWLPAVPGAAIALVVVCVNLVSDAWINDEREG